MEDATRPCLLHPVAPMYPRFVCPGVVSRFTLRCVGVCCGPLQYAWIAKLLDARDMFTAMAAPSAAAPSSHGGDASTSVTDHSSLWAMGLADSFMDGMGAGAGRSRASSGLDYSQPWSGAAMLERFDDRKRLPAPALPPQASSSESDDSRGLGILRVCLLSFEAGVTQSGIDAKASLAGHTMLCINDSDVATTIDATVTNVAVDVVDERRIGVRAPPHTLIYQHSATRLFRRATWSFLCTRPSVFTGPL